jgi:hypothetical protein
LPAPAVAWQDRRVGRLDELDLSQKLSRAEEAKRLEAAQERLLA